MQPTPSEAPSSVVEVPLTQNCFLCRSDVSLELVRGIPLRTAHSETITLSICNDCQKKYLTMGVALVNPESDSAIVLRDEAFSALFSEPIPSQRVIHVKEELLEQVHSLFRDFKEYENRLALGETFLDN